VSQTSNYTIERNVRYDEFVEIDLSETVQDTLYNKGLQQLADQLEVEAKLLKEELKQEESTDEVITWILNITDEVVSSIRDSDFFSSKELVADVYYTRPGPPIILIHGGALIGGDKSSFEPDARDLAEKGYVVFVINYRLAPVDSWPAMIEDCRLALSWVLNPAVVERYDLQIENGVAIGGHSAGGHLAGLLSTEVNEEVSRDQIACAVLLAAPTDMVSILNSPDQAGETTVLFERLVSLRSLLLQVMMAVISSQDSSLGLSLEELRLMSPLYHVMINQAGTEYPPILILQGELDQLVPPEQGNALDLALREVGAFSQLETVDSGHGLDLFFRQSSNQELWSAENWQIIVDFLDQFSPTDL
jgi:acetyl esterase/lipase|tara:strand:+ start:684 stop:1766 length:1083 start_codon:yes stop_codon:yes gene_type:complete